MNEQEQIIAIAEHMGWFNIKPNPLGGVCGTYSEDDDAYFGIPDYPTDLNSCHEFEKTLTDSQRPQYESKLTSIIRTLRGIPPHESHYSESFTTYATASQRCEAFLKTVGLWNGDL